MKKPVLIHPYLFGVFPVLFLYARNGDHFSLGVLVVPLVVTLLLVWVSVQVVGGVSRDARFGALVVSLCVLLFFSYGHARSVILQVGFVRAADKTLFALFGVLVAAGASVGWRMRPKLRLPTRMANWMSVSLVLISVVDVAGNLWKTDAALRRVGDVADSGAQLASHAANGSDPDIYYIIVDGYGRSDVLQEPYAYDNSDFLEFLKSRGFYVAMESRTNYMQTLLSLASSLNLAYLDDVAARVGTNFRGREPLKRMIRNSRLVRSVRRRGYEFVAFADGYDPTDVSGAADVYMGPKELVGYFADALIITTALRPVLWKWGIFDSYDQHRDRILFTLREVGELPRGSAPKFVLAHTMAPHPPFVLGPQGEPLHPNRDFSLFDGIEWLEQLGATREEYINGYRNQVVFLNRVLKGVIDRILSSSGGNAVIIVQGDHGPRLTMDWNSLDPSNCKGCFGILNAYYLPGVTPTQLYPEISPVNSFRVVLNEYFNAAYKLLPDASYLSTWEHPYRLVKVTTDLRVDHANPPGVDDRMRPHGLGRGRRLGQVHRTGGESGTTVPPSR